MKLTQSVIQKYFTVTHKGKTYYIDFINSDDAILLGNRDGWEVLNGELEPIDDIKLTNKLVNFCVKHFDDYKVEL
ncbi:MAG: hypothetical protein U9O94_00925 [Nanoarchaeota archaeon]|nr:hypothetical protein [Nanoarchaeota archaeon]